MPTLACARYANGTEGFLRQFLHVPREVSYPSLSVSRSSSAEYVFGSLPSDTYASAQVLFDRH